MTSRRLNATLFIATCLFSTWAVAQNTYKCGDNYSQTPCPGAVAIDATDKRSREQKVQTDEATRRNAETAQSLEKNRREQEKKDLQANTPVTKPASGDSRDTPDQNQVTTKKKKKEPKYFTAQVPGQKKKKHASVKKTPSLDKDGSRS